MSDNPKPDSSRSDIGRASERGVKPGLRHVYSNSSGSYANPTDQKRMIKRVGEEIDDDLSVSDFERWRREEATRDRGSRG